MSDETTPPAADEPPHVVFLKECGEALYGSSWQTELARELTKHRATTGGKPIDVATVRRWTRGVYKPSAFAWIVIGNLLASRSKRQKELYDQLTRQPMWDSLHK